MSDLERFSVLKKQIAQMQRECDKAQGALEEIQKRLKTEFGCKTLDEAEVLLEELKAEVKTIARKFRKEIRVFERKYREFLG